jgi:hypothetical protein
MDYKKKYLKYKKKYFDLKIQNGGNSQHVIEAWNQIIDNASYLKIKYGDKFDGLKYWNSIKPFLNDIDNRMHEEIIWNKNHDIVISNFSLVRSLITEYDENNKLIEKNHFLLQQLNIPKKDNGNASFVRLMQIALNIGQMQKYINEYPDNIKQLIDQNNLSNINTYMTNDNYNKYLFNHADLIKLINILQKLRKNPTLK